MLRNREPASGLPKQRVERKKFFSRITGLSGKVSDPINILGPRYSTEFSHSVTILLLTGNPTLD